MRIPQDWDVAERRRIGPFTTALLLHRPDGSRVRWSAWHHRKGVDLQASPEAAGPGRWWTPRSLAWWISVLFAVGSVLFAAGSFAPSAAALGSAVGPVFFAGSVFFTGGAYLQFYEATNASPVVGKARRTRRLFGANTSSLGWWMAVVQLIGTLWFNVNTYEAMQSLCVPEQEALVWAPDVIGSLCFLVASYLALLEACGRWWCVHGRTVPWRIAIINLAGSLAFGISAAAAYVVPATGEELSASWASAGTFIGALCFLIGALIPMPLFARARAPRRG